jgi:hypothetical protein
MTGKKGDIDKLPALREELGVAGFAILAAKFRDDAGRPDYPEVRYFNASDKDQAEKLAEYMRVRLSSKSLLANVYKDATARPGYIEIWLGR